MQILKAWSSVGDIDQEDKMRMCWEHELYWAGFNLARSSKLPLSIKLASLAGCNRVPPESLVTELLDRKSGAVTQSDQDAAALLRFAALYDNACRNGGSKADLTKLVSAAIAIAPRALRLLDGSYPPGRNYSHFQPVEYEVDQCYLAILSIVPAKDRTNAIIKMMKSLGAGGIWAMSNCAAREWVPAVETECDLHSDDDWAVLRWRTALLEHLSVDLRGSRDRLTAKRKVKPSLHRWRTQVRQLMETLRTQSYKDQPDHLTKFLQELDSKLWRIHVLLSLETARIRADRGLLKIVAKELVSQRARIYDPDGDPMWNSARDLTCLYQSGYRAAWRVRDKDLQQEFLKRIVAILPRAVGEDIHHPYAQIPGILKDFEGEIPVWLRLVCDGPRDSAMVERFEDQMLKPGGPSDTRSLGAFWAIAGAPKAKAGRIRRAIQVSSEISEVAYGVGLAVGCRCSTLSVSEAWMSLCEAGFGGTLKRLTAFVNGYAEAREDPRAIWSARLVRQLGHRQQDAK